MLFEGRWTFEIGSAFIVAMPALVLYTKPGLEVNKM